jgi:predicted O-linked N-acetylglucosamine transferase (SPINDLY family)
MATIPEALALALRRHQEGRFDAAEQIYQRILQVEPQHPDALHFLGVLSAQLCRHQAAADYITRAIAVNPNIAPYHLNLGRVYHESQRLDEAIACYRRALQLQPDFAEVHFNLGNALAGQGQVAEAAACYRRTVQLKPDFADAHNNLGHAFLAQNNLDDAADCFCRALQLKPNFADAHYNLGHLLKGRGELDKAIACYRRAVELKPDFIEACHGLGLALASQGRLDEAVACCRRVLELKPGSAEAHSNLGNALKEQGKLDEAVACYRRALELKPDFVEACSNLGLALGNQGKLDEAVACYRRALELQPGCAAAHSSLLCALQCRTGVTLAALAEAHADYDRRHAAPLGPSPQQTSVRSSEARDPRGRLRLGFVSPDLGRHPVGFFLVRVLENLRREQSETICYFDRSAKDDVTHRLQAAATEWRDVIGMSDQQLAEQIRVDRIDILFDLAGHTAHNRLLTFARKPAPIQITWLGYVGTTGLTAIDYLLADRHEVPPGWEAYYREKVLRLPDGYLCFDPPDEAPPVGPLPALAQGHATFGCFNNRTKITSQAIGVWAEILRRMPRSRLVLKYRGLEGEGIGRDLLAHFAAQGIEPARVDLLGWSPRKELLAHYNGIDLALDTFPYSGGLTTCEALWMGVPVITCPLETFASRHSLSHLSNVHLTETIARNLDDYVDRAVSLASDLPRLVALRAGLRQRTAASPLCDGKRFALHLESILRGVWAERMA